VTKQYAYAPRYGCSVTCVNICPCFQPETASRCFFPYLDNTRKPVTCDFAGKKTIQGRSTNEACNDTKTRRSIVAISLSPA